MAKQVNPQKIKDLQSAMSRASKLMKLETNGTLDKIAEGKRSDIDASLNTNNITTESMMSTVRNSQRQGPAVGGNMGAVAENVPSVIRESFMKNPIDTSALYSGLGDGKDISFITDMIQPKQQQVVQEQKNVRQIVNEGLQYQTSQQVDYPMIKTIVEEVVRKYAVSLKNKLITEGKDSESTLNTLTIGKSFKFLDNSGNIYEAKLTKIGNIHDKKKKNIE